MSYADPAKAPKDDKIIIEAPGVVTSDSLAAESYAQGQREGDSSAHFDAVPQSVPSKSTTANTTDNTNATILPAAPDRPARPDDDSYVTPADDGTTASTTGTSQSSADTAPSYVSASLNANADSKPAGDATEGDFDTAGAARPRIDAEPGSRADPGREALKTFERGNALNPADVRDGVAQGEGDGQSGFENLDAEAEA